MLNSLKPVDLKIQEHLFDFNKNKQVAFNANAYSEKLESSVGFVKSDMPFSVDNEVLQMKYFDGKLYLVLSDGYLYAYEGYVKKICDVKISSTLNFGYVDFRGNKSLIVASASNSVLLYDNELYILPFSTADFQYAFGRIFYYKDNTIFFTKQYDFFSEPEGAIKIDDLNSFRKLYLIHDELFLICQHEIYKIPRFADAKEIKLTVVPVNVENINLNTIWGVDDCIYFLKGRDLCKFDGKNITSFTTCISSHDYIIDTVNTGVHNGYVNIRVINNERGNMLYQYNVKTGEETLIDYPGKLFSCYSACIDSDGTIMFLVEGGKRDVVYRSVDTDFSIKKNKRTYSISGYASKPTTVTLIGDFGEKVFSFKKGYNEIFCNYESMNFKVKISCFDENVLIQGLKIKYTTID